MPRVDCDDENQPTAVWLSAQQTESFELLTNAMKARLATDLLHTTVILTPEKGGVRHQLFEMGAVLSEVITEQGDYQLEVRLPKTVFQQLKLVSY